MWERVLVLVLVLSGRVSGKVKGGELWKWEWSGRGGEKKFVEGLKRDGDG
jgi:hypothetical protein